MKTVNYLVSLIAISMILGGCGSHSEKDEVGTSFNTGATVTLSGTTQKDSIKINTPVQIIASTLNGTKTPEYIAVSSKQEIANVSAIGQVITIIGVKAGKTKIIIIDNANGQAIAEFDTTVVASTTGNGDNTGGGTGTGGDGIPDEDPDNPDVEVPVTEKEIGPVGEPVSIAVAGANVLFRSIPYGKFMRGDSSIASETTSRPRHLVNITEPFWMNEFEVTNAQFVTFLNDVEENLSLQNGIISGDYNRDGVKEVWIKIKPVSIGFIEADLTVSEENKDLPVIDVTWYGAMAYARWLSTNHTGTYRLPTEAEWEYATRGNQRNNEGLITYVRYPWGLDSYSNAYANSFGVGGQDSFSKFAPVGSFPLGKNLYGLYDTIGNAAEWTYDTYEAYNSLEKTNPYGLDANGDKVYRGGSWGDSGNQSSSSARNSLDPAIPSSTIGFRLVHYPQGKDPLGVHLGSSTN